MDVMGLVWLIVDVLLVGVAFYAIVWLIDWMEIPPPINKIIKVLVGILLILLVLALLLGAVPVGVHPWRLTR